MPADLTTASFFHRSSMVLQDDHLVILEHQSTQDRVRRFGFDRIESVTYWHRPPWVHIAVYLALFGLPGLAVLALENVVVYIAGGVLMAIGLSMALWYAYRGKTSIRIARVGDDYTVAGIASRRKVRRFLARLEAAIRHAQEQPVNPTASQSNDPQQPPQT